MHIYDKMEYLCGLKNVTIPEAYTAMRINKGTVSLWKTARDNGEPVIPSTKNAIKMSEYFGYPTDYFLQGNEFSDLDTKKEPTTNGDEHSKEDLELLDSFHAADAKTQAAIRLLLSNSKEGK